MRVPNDSDLTGNAWTERVEYLRQLIDDGYDTTGDEVAAPAEYVNWLIENSEEEFGPDDERVLLRRAREIYEGDDA